MTRKPARHHWRRWHDASHCDKAGKSVPDEIVLAGRLMWPYRSVHASFNLDSETERTHAKHAKQQRTEQ